MRDSNEGVVCVDGDGSGSGRGGGKMIIVPVRTKFAFSVELYKLCKSNCRSTIVVFDDGLEQRSKAGVMRPCG